MPFSVAISLQKDKDEDKDSLYISNRGIPGRVLVKEHQEFPPGVKDKVAKKLEALLEPYLDEFNRLVEIEKAASKARQEFTASIVTPELQQQAQDIVDNFKTNYPEEFI